MGLFSRKPRQTSPSPPKATPESSVRIVPTPESLEHHSVSPAQRTWSKDSEGYPSWLPKRPPPPAPASTFQSSAGTPTPMCDHVSSEPSTPGPASWGGRKPTPRSIRIVSLTDDRRVPTDHTRVPSTPLQPRVWSRATAGAISPTVFDGTEPKPLQPRFRANGLHLELLRSPSVASRLYFALFHVLVFLHIPLQTFLDFNAVFIIYQVAKYPNPEAPGVPGSGKNWALAMAAYIACWVFWIFGVFILYEVVYSFARRWRIKRPLMLPIYMSSPAFNLASITSYSNFCFLHHLRYAAFFGENGSFRDGLAETCWYYAQNLPTVALLLPRAGLAIALLLSYSSPQTSEVLALRSGGPRRDGTFFHGDDGTLTAYAQGVLYANAAWTGWRIVVLFGSWLGLWIMSGQAFGGLCGPRYRWDEEETEKRLSMFSDNMSVPDTVLWDWRERTKERLQEAFEFCLTIKHRRHWSGPDGKQVSETTQLVSGVSRASPAPFDGMDRVMAAVGLPSSPAPARRPVLSEDLFSEPGPSGTQHGLSDVIPPVKKRSSKEERAPGESEPLKVLPYPFTAPSARGSSSDKVPFPPSPVLSSQKQTTSEGTEEHDTEEGEEEEEEEEGGVTSGTGEVEQPSEPRTSASMSSLGQPINSRYPFQFRHPRRGNSLSSGSPSHITPHSHGTTPSSNSHQTPSTGNSHHQTPSSNSRSAQSRLSHGAQSASTRYHESIDSHSPRSQYTSTSSDMPSPMSSNGIPMPPRHPGREGRRARAGTVPSSIMESPSPVNFPRGSRPRAQTRAGDFGSALSSSEALQSDFDDSYLDDSMAFEHPEPEGSHEAAENEDSVGLLSQASSNSPRPSLLGSPRHRSRSGSASRTNSHSDSSRSRAGSFSLSVRERTQSLMQSVSAASQSSIDLVAGRRSRVNSSMARLEEDTQYMSDRTHSRSGSSSDAVASSGENYTFGVPLRHQWQARDEQRVDEEPEPTSPTTSTFPTPTIRAPPSPRVVKNDSDEDITQHIRDDTLSHVSEESYPGQGDTVSIAAPSAHLSEITVSASPPDTSRSREGLAIPGRERQSHEQSSGSSHRDLSTAPASFVTGAPTMQDSTSSRRGPSSWGDSHMVDRSDDAWRNP
ncbi:hypothetical protein K523DRAFT_357477 [Schizophyllum commune Tattone D]|nr:hypothetical protein K523DRAFT_357477 [Schizophyllum commune Tattone D]